MTAPGGWIGRSETAVDWVSPSAQTRFAAMLDHDEPPVLPGDAIRPLGHWLLFLPHDVQSSVGPDGYGEGGGLLPVDPKLPRRMWAGSRISFPGVIRAGMTLQRRSSIAKVTEKIGKSGRLVFVTVQHSIGEPDGAPLLIEEHDVVYRPLSGAASGNPPPAPPAATWRRRLLPDEHLLFRYSALTFNGHRIHYDLPYAREEERYPGLVVQAPLVATLMVDLVRRNLADVRILDLSFKAMAPLFAGNSLTLHGKMNGENAVALWTTNAEGELASTAEATICCEA